MFKHLKLLLKKEAEIKLPPNLTRAEKKRIEEIKDRVSKKRKVPVTAQESIPFVKMYPSGICKVDDSFYSGTIQFEDINYKAVKKEDKTEFFEEWCSFLNFFDSSVRFELTYLNQKTDVKSLEKILRIEHREDGLNEVRDEFNEMLLKQLKKGHHGLTRTKYLTFGIHAASLKEAKAKLKHIEEDILNNFKRIKVEAKTLNGKERLQVMHAQFHLGSDEKFYFDWKWLASSGLNCKDFIAPSSFAFTKGRSFQVGGLYEAVSCLSITAPEISDQMLTDLLNTESSQIVTMHVRSVEQSEALKMVKRIISELDKSKIDEQKKALRSGYDMDILPSDLVSFGNDAKDLFREIQNQNERMFLLTFLVLNTGRTEQELENNIFRTASIAQQKNCNLIRLDYQQEQGLMSHLPLAKNLIPIHRGLTTSSTAIFVPFCTKELFQKEKGAIYYGINCISKNIILVDRKKLKNPNALIVGTPGGGKSMATKREIIHVFFVTGDHIMITDPEDEYTPLVILFHGQVIKISPSSQDYINPMEISLDYAADENPIALKVDFLFSFCELILDRKNGLEAVERTVIDRCARQIYQEFFLDPKEEKMPILEDLYDRLLEQEEPEAHHVAKSLEMYVHGTHNIFNHRTNVNVTNRLVSFNVKELGGQLKKIGMLIIQDYLWSRVGKNRAQGISTRYYIDEMHLLLKEPLTAAYMVEIWKRFRKWGGIPTGITQNIKDFLDGKEVENIFENSDFILMLSQGPEDKEILAKRLKLSEEQLAFVTQASVGQGLLFYGDVVLPFEDQFPTDTQLYKIMTTKLSETVPKVQPQVTEGEQGV